MKLLDKEGLTYYTSKVKGQLATKQPLIDNNNKLPYSLLSGTPTIPTKTSDLTNDSDYTTKTYVDSLVGDIETILTTLDVGSGVNGN